MGLFSLFQLNLGRIFDIVDPANTIRVAPGIRTASASKQVTALQAGSSVRSISVPPQNTALKAPSCIRAISAR